MQFVDANQNNENFNPRRNTIGSRGSHRRVQSGKSITSNGAAAMSQSLLGYDSQELLLRKSNAALFDKSVLGLNKGRY